MEADPLRFPPSAGRPNPLRQVPKVNLATSLRCGTLAILLPLLAGCTSETPSIAKVTNLPPSRSAADPSDEKGAADSKPKASDQVARALAAYQPPFPERQEMFVPPKQSAESRHVQAEGGAVELKGFVEVDQPRVILDIDGTIAALPVGTERFGVKVVAIEGGKVTLERNRTRWTATFD